MTKKIQAGQKQRECYPVLSCIGTPVRMGRSGENDGARPRRVGPGAANLQFGIFHEPKVLPGESGEVWWDEISPAQGLGQRGRRLVAVPANGEYLDALTELVVVLPRTSVDRSWPNHIRSQGDLSLDKPTFAMTEQPRTISRSRLKDRAGQVLPDYLDEIAQWVDDWLVY